MSVVASLNLHLFHLKKAARARPSTDNVLKITEVSAEGSNPRITNKKKLSSPSRKSGAQLWAWACDR
jgi:hypothetical protein